MRDTLKLKGVAPDRSQTCRQTLISILPSSDQSMVKPLFLMVLATTLATAGSPPAEPKVTAEPAEPSSPVKFAIVHVEAGKPEIVRICYLDEGTREVVVPPAPQNASELAPSPNPGKPEGNQVEASEPQIVHIFNSGEGNREIVIPPVP